MWTIWKGLQFFTSTPNLADLYTIIVYLIDFKDLVFEKRSVLKIFLNQRIFQWPATFFWMASDCSKSEPEWLGLNEKVDAKQRGWWCLRWRGSRMQALGKPVVWPGTRGRLGEAANGKCRHQQAPAYQSCVWAHSQKWVETCAWTTETKSTNSCLVVSPG